MQLFLGGWLLLLLLCVQADQIAEVAETGDPADGDCPDCSPPSMQLLQTTLQLSRAVTALGAKGSAELAQAHGSNSASISASIEADGELASSDSDAKRPPPEGSAEALALLLRSCSGLNCLRSYVEAPDSAYAWEDTSVRLRGSVRGTEWTAAVLHLTSQHWLADQVKPGVWNHSLVVVAPQGGNATFQTAWCTLYMAFGFYGSAAYPSESIPASDPDVLAAAEIAVSTGTAAAVLFNVPAEFLTFEKDYPAKPVIEDAEMARSWALFGGLRLEASDSTQGSQPNWQPEPKFLAELPMTKAVVRAMDALSDFSRGSQDSRRSSGFLPSPLTRFALVGTSKRGHLCWHAAAVDERVGAIVPMVKALNLRDFLDLTKRYLGGIPVAARDYWSWGLFAKFIDSPQGQWIRSITDAYGYADRFASLPKYVISASNDDFFMPDHTRIWWPAMPGPKWNLMVPNSPHIVGGQQVLALAPTISSFIAGVMSAAAKPAEQSRALPALSWTLDPSSGAITAQLTDAAASAPQSVQLWKAVTCDGRRRDFRFHNADQGEVCRKCGIPSAQGMCENQQVNFSSSPLAETAPRSRRWVATMAAPADGRWAAFFIAFRWSNGLYLSTEVSVVPDTLPFLGGQQPCNRSDLV